MGQKFDIWNQTCMSLLELVEAGEYKRWFSTLIPLSFENNTFRLGAVNDFTCHWLESNWQNLLEETLSEICQEKVSVEFEGGHILTPKKSEKEASTRLKRQEIPAPRRITAKSLPSPIAARNLKAEQPAKAEASIKSAANCNPQHTFERFIVGDNSRFASAASHAVAASPGMIYNPLFIYGNSATGKTHLMQAIANDVVSKNPSAKILYTTSELFFNEYIEAIQTQKGGTNNDAISKFRKRYRSLDLLLIDDVQFFKGKVRLQEEFFHTFNQLHNDNKQIILTSDRPPHEIAGLEQRLVTRFESGQVVDITYPDYETRIGILRQRQSEQKVKLDDNIIDFIASRVKSNVRALQSALMSLTSHVSLFKENVTLEIAEQRLARVLEKECSKRLTVNDIQKLVAEHYNITVAELKGKRRTQNIALPRQVAMFLSRELTEESSTSIGESFDRNHATILHGHKEITKKSKQDKNMQSSLSQIKRQLSGQNQ